MAEKAFRYPRHYVFHSLFYYGLETYLCLALESPSARQACPRHVPCGGGTNQGGLTGRPTACPHVPTPLDPHAISMPSDTHESFPSDTRDEILEADRHKCQICGAKGSEKGGAASLETHHIEDDPDDVAYHDAENGTTLCSVCHNYVTNRIPDDLPFNVADIENDLKLQPYDLEILSVLARRGPVTLLELVANITDAKSENATRERLWHLMGHDDRIDHLPHQLVDQDADTGEWGLPNQIDRSARGRIPDDKDKLLQRFEDEMVRWLLDAGLDRPTVADIVEVGERTTYHREKRARAYQIPLGDQSPSGASYRNTTESEAESLESVLLDRPLPSEDHTASRGEPTDPDETTWEDGDVEETLTEISQQLAELTNLVANSSKPASATVSPPDDSPQTSD